ncbi:GNAT family N-acetyltransferase [Pararhizobium haloflavum]|uniref:GNAT family N-acetyltransferase n=1 Tax=Pararhizobium haloflavum TaxID=2037914 RepID=UPI0013000174|nr:GNAT family N-acetyltransferase [Pararhizobium haloflavum]
MIRPARQDDAAILADVGFRAWQDKLSVWASSPDDAAAIIPNAKAAFASFTRDGWQTILVAQIDGAIVGWGARENGDHTISDLWVDPSLQHHGAGSALLIQLENDMVAAGYKVAALETHARNEAAIAFYQRRGYAVKWLSTKYAAGLDRDIEKVGMEKSLTARVEASDAVD